MCSKNFNFLGDLSAFGAENQTKSRPFKLENNAQKLPKQLKQKSVHKKEILQTSLKGNLG